jgi:D-threo-aldose 1-dehydrogenase
MALLRLQYCPSNILKNEMKILKFITIVTKDVEVKVIEKLKITLQSMLLVFKTSIKEDEILLNEKSVIQNNRVYHAVNLRLSEKKILKENLSLLEDHEAQVLLNLKSSFSDSLSSTLILGCSSLAGLYQPIGEENSLSVIQSAIELGFTSFDTAPHYALGLGEERLGRGLRGQNTSSSKVYTKAGRLILDQNDVDSTMRIEHDNVPGSPNCIFPESPLNRVPVRNYTYQGIMKSYEDSLKRLGLNQGIFGLRIHDCEDEVSLHEVLNGGLAALIELKNNKMIIEVSFGLNSPQVALLLLKEAKSQNLKVDSIMIAGSYNLLDHDIDSIKLFYFCQVEKIEIHNAGIYCSGILAGSHYYKYDIAPSDKLESLRQWKTLCDEYNFSVKEVALAFSLMPAVVSKVAVGVKSREEVEELVQNYQRLEIIAASNIFKEAKKRRLLASHVII